MRLLHARRIQPISFDGPGAPPYAILSHTWGTDEVSFQDIQSPDAASKAGYKKIRYACQEALREGLEYVWVDTCCIDKTSSAELSEAINSMFRWYQNANICYAYLSDVSGGTDVYSPDSAFARSGWFSRGWTLQELLAPFNLKFFSSDWQDLGSKHDLSKQISDITSIDEGFITGKDHFSEASIAKRMSWASWRKTTRTEDLAYCLLGIFQINMPLLYGEGEKAFIRLQEEIMKHSDDQTLFAWGYDPHQVPSAVLSPCGAFAGSPNAFRESGDFIPDELNESGTSYAITNKGIQINLPIIKLSRYEFHLAVLACRPENRFLWVVAIPVRFHGPDSIMRLGTNNCYIVQRDDVAYASSRSLRFPASIYKNIQLWEPVPECPTLLIRKIPRSESQLSIWKVEPSDVWDPEQRIIQFSKDDKRHIVIRLWRSEGEGFAILLSGKNSSKSHVVFQEIKGLPLSYDTLGLINRPRKLHPFATPQAIRVTRGERNIRMSTGTVIRTLDIELETYKVD
jgi:hypothetical protein